MSKNRKKMIVGAGGVAVALSLALAALGPTGAYFSDTDQGNMTGAIGSIKVTGTNTDLAYTNMLPGEPQTVTAGFENTGLNNQDVWVVFNNEKALHAINNLGKYGNFAINSGGNAIFASTNLQDGAYAATNSCGNVFTEADRGCWPLRKAYKLATNLAPEATGDVSFTFAYGAAMTFQPEAAKKGEFPWNSYPVQFAGGEKYPEITGNGLPYQIVATQVGIDPGTVGVN